MVEHICKNCKYWNWIGVEPTIGWCRSRDLFDALNYAPTKKESDPRPTSGCFGCIHWEEKEQEVPFSASDVCLYWEYANQRAMIFGRDNSLEALAKVLNRLWTRRDEVPKAEWMYCDGSPMHFCEVTEFYVVVVPGEHCKHCGAKAPTERSK